MLSSLETQEQERVKYLNGLSSTTDSVSLSTAKLRPLLESWEVCNRWLIDNGLSHGEWFLCRIGGSWFLMKPVD